MRCYFVSRLKPKPQPLHPPAKKGCILMKETLPFYAPTVWNSVLLIAILLGSLMLAQILKTKGPLKKSLIPNAVLGGVIVLVISAIVRAVTGEYLFDLPTLAGNANGMNILEILTYHCLAVGFIAMSLRPTAGKKTSRQRTGEVLNSGMLTISGYLIQGIIGVAVTVIGCLAVKHIAPGSGILLAFGFGQGTGQAMTQGVNFDTALGSGEIYKNLGLAIAAIGFLVASLGGVVVLNVLRRRHLLQQPTLPQRQAEELQAQKQQLDEELNANESVDKLSLQFALIFIAYSLAYGIMILLGRLAGGMIGTVYGFNFLFGVLAAIVVRSFLKLLVKTGICKYQFNNGYLLSRISGFAFDLMIVSGICAIQIHQLRDYLWLLVILTVLGTAGTFAYVWFVCKKLFPDYCCQQFLTFFGMLTGTASTGMILLREADPKLESPAADNLVYQNFPAILLALPLLVLTSSLYTDYASATGLGKAVFILIALIIYLIAVNLVLFRSLIFKKKKPAEKL